MLVLTRKPGQVIMVGNEIAVIVLGVDGHRVRIGVKAPKNIAVHREEIFQRIKHGQRRSKPKADS